MSVGREGTLLCQTKVGVNKDVAGTPRELARRAMRKGGTGGKEAGNCGSVPIRRQSCLRASGDLRPKKAWRPCSSRGLVLFRRLFWKLFEVT